MKNPDIETGVQVFPSDSLDPAHVRLVGSQVESIAENPDGRVVIASRNGALTLDKDTANVQISNVFERPYQDVQLIETRDSVWIHGRVDRTSDLPRQPIEERHELLKLGDASPRFSFECTSVGVAEYVGYQAIDFGGDDHPSLVTLCWDESNRHYANVVDLNVGDTKRIEIPFPATGALIGEHGAGKQSLVLLSYQPFPLYECREGAPISRCSDTQSISGVTYVLEENSESELVGRIAESIPTADSYGHHNVAQFMHSRAYLDGELLLNNAIFSGRLFLQWSLSGKIKNWWNFKRNEKVREILKWIDLPQSPSNGISAIVVTRIWGGWCRFPNCGYRIIQLSKDGAYRVIDSTSHKVDDIMISGERDLIASWDGKVYRYDLKNVDETIPWQKSQLTESQMKWISEHSD